MHHRPAALALMLVGLTLAVDGQRAPSPAMTAKSAVIDVSRMAGADELIRQAIGEKLLPGAVLLVGRGDEIVYERAYGNRAVVPAIEPMTPDTIFDMASVTKVVATTTSVMILIEDGRIRLTDRVATFIPGFGKYGKNAITIRHLLTHVSGLRPDIDLNDEFRGADVGDRARLRGGAGGCARRALHLQRHQLLPPRRHRQARQRAAARPVRARAGVPASRHDRDDVQPARVVAAGASLRPRAARRSAGRARGPTR